MILPRVDIPLLHAERMFLSRLRAFAALSPAAQQHRLAELEAELAEREQRAAQHAASQN